MAHGILQFPYQGWNPHTLHWKYRVLSTGPPGTSHKTLILNAHMFRSLRCPETLAGPSHPPPISLSLILRLCLILCAMALPYFTRHALLPIFSKPSLHKELFPLCKRLPHPPHHTQSIFLMPLFLWLILKISSFGKASPFEASPTPSETPGEMFHNTKRLLDVVTLNSL